MKRKRRRLGLLGLVLASRDLFESGLIAGATHRGQVLAIFLDCEARGEPYARALAEYSIVDGRPVRADGEIVGGPIGDPAPEPEPAKPAGKWRPSPDHAGKEQTPLAGDIYSAAGKDRRLWFEVAEKEAFLLNAEIAGEVVKHQLNAIEATTLFRIISHMTTAMLAAGYPAELLTIERDGQAKHRDQKHLINEQTAAYRERDRAGIYQWREWMRSVLARYLREKRTAALQEVQMQAYGDAPTRPEEASQEPAVAAEDESQLQPAGASGDAWEPGRE